MAERTTHEEYVAMQRRRVANLAQQILSQEIDVLDGSSQIADLRYELKVDDNDDDLMAFQLIQSETDALPIGAEAQNWSEEALARKEPELRRAREWAFKMVREECERLISRFSDA
jgi:hypothetical protein